MARTIDWEIPLSAVKSFDKFYIFSANVGSGKNKISMLLMKRPSETQFSVSDGFLINRLDNVWG